jgi:hypothetical protein
MCISCYISPLCSSLLCFSGRKWIGGPFQYADGMASTVLWLKDAMHLAEFQVVQFWFCVDTQAGEMKSASWVEI